MQQYLQIADFQSVEKQSAPRSKFVKVILRVSVSMMSVRNSFGRSGEMPGKYDSFGRSAGQIYGENGSLVPVAMVIVLYSFGRSREMTGKRDSFGRSA